MEEAKKEIQKTQVAIQYRTRSSLIMGSKYYSQKYILRHYYIHANLSFARLIIDTIESTIVSVAIVLCLIQIAAITNSLNELSALQPFSYNSNVEYSFDVMHIVVVIVVVIIASEQHSLLEFDVDDRRQVISNSLIIYYYFYLLGCGFYVNRGMNRLKLTNPLKGNAKMILKKKKMVTLKNAQENSNSISDYYVIVTAIVADIDADGLVMNIANTIVIITTIAITHYKLPINDAAIVAFAYRFWDQVHLQLLRIEWFIDVIDSIDVLVTIVNKCCCFECLTTIFWEEHKCKEELVRNLERLK